MDRDDFQNYIDSFNRRDYDTLHREYFAKDVKLYTLGYLLSGQKAVRDFYDFFHPYVEERLQVINFHPFPGGFIGEIRMELTATRAFTAEAARAGGFSRLPPIANSQTYATTLFIDYRLENERFTEIRCAEFPDLSDD